MLYIDQPSMTGFSYDMLVNSTLDLFTLEVAPIDPENSVEASPFLLEGTLPSFNPEHIPVNTLSSARTMWHFAQVWFNE